MSLPKRKKNRLQGYDYSQNGAYFITVCVQDKKRILSKIIVGDGLPVPHLTVYGQIVEKCIQLINQKYPEVKIEKYVIMPNHIHILAEILHRNFRDGQPVPYDWQHGWLAEISNYKANKFNKKFCRRKGLAAFIL